MGDSYVREKVFNSAFEFSVRTLVLLAEIEKPISLDRIVAYDFLATYASEFIPGQPDLNGQNLLKFSEFASRREVTKRAIKDLLFRNLIKVSSDLTKGFEYVISISGNVLAEKIKNEYINQYRKNLSCVEEKYKNFDDIRLTSLINAKAINELEG